MLQMLQAGFPRSGRLTPLAALLGMGWLQHLQQVAPATGVVRVVWPLDVADVACVRMTTEITLLTLFPHLHSLILCAPHAQATSATLRFLLAGDPRSRGFMLAQASTLSPRPPPPSPSAADDEPPPGHPAWDRPPVEEPDGWELADWNDAEPTDMAWAAPAPFMACDVPALHKKVAAYLEPGGGTALLCPYCGQRHRHGGFGHRLAHCADPQGRGYVLIEVEVVPPWLVHRAPTAASDRELRR